MARYVYENSELGLFDYLIHILIEDDDIAEEDISDWIAELLCRRLTALGYVKLVDNCYVRNIEKFQQKEKES